MVRCRIMRRLYGVALLLLIASSCISCDKDPYAGKRPIDYPDSVWICENPIYIYIEYNEINELEEAYIYQENSESISIVYGLYDDTLIIVDEKDNVLIRFNAKYSEIECILTVYESNITSINAGDELVLINNNAE
jgi:hypothetical protein